MKRSMMEVANQLGIPLRIGKNRCFSPSHRDSSPSLRVWPDHFYCFGCGIHGDTIDLVRAVRGCSFREAVAFVGEDIATFKVASPYAQPESKLQPTLSSACEEALSRLWHGNLSSVFERGPQEPSKGLLGWIERRGIVVRNDVGLLMAESSKVQFDLSPSELDAIGFVNSEGKLFLGFCGSLEGIVFPVFSTLYDFPVSYRLRLFEPVYGIKTVSMRGSLVNDAYGIRRGTSGTTWIVDGEPDFMVVCSSVAHREDTVLMHTGSNKWHPWHRRYAPDTEMWVVGVHRNAHGFFKRFKEVMAQHAPWDNVVDMTVEESFDWADRECATR